MNKKIALFLVLAVSSICRASPNTIENNLVISKGKHYPLCQSLLKGVNSGVVTMNKCNFTIRPNNELNLKPLNWVKVDKSKYERLFKLYLSYTMSNINESRIKKMRNLKLNSFQKNEIDFYESHVKYLQKSKEKKIILLEWTKFCLNPGSPSFRFSVFDATDNDLFNFDHYRSKASEIPFLYDNKVFLMDLDTNYFYVYEPLKERQGGFLSTRPVCKFEK